MAGPGGGPPRKSHTKSRKGCKTCKRRHIRCDELFPQCRNCTKHNCRCDYRDSPPPLDESSSHSAGPDLLWTSSIEKEIDNWRRTGIFPFPELNLTYTHQFTQLSETDLRLVHHISSIYQEAKQKSMLSCSVWLQDIPLFLETAAGYDFVMSAILAFSASHLANVTGSTETTNLQYYHHGIALKGLHGAIGAFSRENADPILAASILLSWRVSDWGGWISLMQGMSTVISHMGPWKTASRFVAIFEDHAPFQSPKPMYTTSPLGPAMPMGSESFLQEAQDALDQLSMNLTADAQLQQRAQEMLQFVRDLTTRGASMGVEQLFQALQPLRTWLLCMPIVTICAEKMRREDVIVLGHLYAVCLAVGFMLPDCNGAILRGTVSRSIEEIDRKLHEGQSLKRPRKIEEMMQFPCHMVAKFNLRRMASTSETPLSGQQSPYRSQTLNFHSQPGTPRFGTYPASAPHSSEDMGMSLSNFGHDYTAQTSRVSSQYLEPVSSPTGTAMEGRAIRGMSYGSVSPSHSPSYNPSYFGNEQGYSYGGEQSPGGYSGGFVAPSVWT